MSLATFIQEERLLPLLEEWKVVVVYDGDHRYRTLCTQLQSDRRLVVDASESSIESREAALQGLQELGKSPTERSIDAVLIYVPTQPPTQDNVKQHDPFASFAAAGTSFPARDGDEYRNLCMAAKLDYAAEVTRLFEAAEPPSMATIDALGSGAGWPTLTSLFNRESPRGLILSLMNASTQQRDELRQHPGWYAEAQSLIQRSIGLALPTDPIQWNELADDLWRYILFSEFVYDLPSADTLPAALSTVNHADHHVKPVIYEICDALRDSNSGRAGYIRRAKTIEQSLDLEQQCTNLDDLGSRDTFPFEEKTFFIQAVDALARDNIDRLRSLIDGHARSIWVDYADNQVKWELLRSALAMIETCADCMKSFKQCAATMEGLIEYYVSEGREVDFRHREFEEAHSRALMHISDHPLEDIVGHTRARYQKAVQRIHGQFTRHLESVGWPTASLPATNAFFDESVAPKLQETGRKIAVFLIDALRYELGHELQKRIGERHKSAQIRPYCASLPSVTPLGMASLLPDAKAQVAVRKVDSKAVVHYGDAVMNNITQRMQLLKKKYGDRFADIKLASLAQQTPQLDNSVDLLIVRSNDIDEQYESSGDPGTALQVIQRSLRDVLASLARLRSLGFEDVYIATDHGFVLHHDDGIGDACKKPQGEWVGLHDRILLGAGSADDFNSVIPAKHLGISGDFADAAFPKALVPYKAGISYFHGGASLQELIVPMLHLKLEMESEETADSVQVLLKYKNDSKHITTRLPFISLSAEAEGLFNESDSIRVRVQAHASDEAVVGEPLSGKHVDTLGIISLNYGETLRIGIKMNDDFEGPFTLRALDPETMVTYGELALKTEYME